MPSSFAMEGPLRSASRTPTAEPESAKAAARFAVTVDLPTPPLPEATATIRRIRASRL